MEIQLDDATVQAAVTEEQVLTLQAQIKHLEGRVIQLNAINRKLLELVEQGQQDAEGAHTEQNEDARLEQLED